MAKVQIQVWGYRCERCGHEWVPRNDAEPRVCPKCKSPYWNRPRRGTVSDIAIAGDPGENGQVEEASGSDVQPAKVPTTRKVAVGRGGKKQDAKGPSSHGRSEPDRVKGNRA